ncbi:MAG: hypothetical protein ACPGOV_10215 [Magnetovibrionaceae bacterium]
MSTQVPPPIVQSPAPPPTAKATQPVVLVANPPPALAKLPLAAQLTATILGNSANGQTSIQTPLGPAQLATGLTLPQQTALQLQVTRAGNQLQLAILKINGKPPEPGQLAGLQAGGPKLTGALSQGGLQAGAAQTAPGGSPTFNAGQTVGLTVLRPFSGQGAPLAGQTGTIPSATGQGASPLAASSGPAGVSTASSSNGQTQQSTAPVPGKPSTAQSAGPSLRQGQSGNAQGQAPQAGSRGVPVPAGSQFSAQVIKVEAPGGGAGGALATQPTAAPGQLAPGGLITARVTGLTPDGSAILEARGLVLGTAKAAGLEVGSSLQLKVSTSPTGPAPLTLPATFAEAELANLQREWPALRTALKTLESADPQAFQQVARALPRADGTALGAGMLLFMSVLRGGDMRALLGEGLDRLTRLNPTIAGRLDRDFQRLKTGSEESREGDWRTVAVPVMNGEELSQVRFHTRNFGGEEDEEGNKGDEGTRFVVDLEMTKLGHLQLDGMVKKRGEIQQLDLIIRSDAPLPGRMRDHIREIFREAGEITGIEGGVLFQAQPPGFIEVRSQGERLRRPGEGLTV